MQIKFLLPFCLMFSTCVMGQSKKKQIEEFGTRLDSVFLLTNSLLGRLEQLEESQTRFRYDGVRRDQYISAQAEQLLLAQNEISIISQIELEINNLKNRIDELTTSNDSLKNLITLLQQSQNNVDETEIGSINASRKNLTLENLTLFNSEKEIIGAFGNNTRREVRWVAEGTIKTYCTILFPNSINEVCFVWKDTLNFQVLEYLHLYGENTEWQTKDGITLGARIKDLQYHNGCAFSFLGLGWDYGGMIDWQNGDLEKRRISGRIGIINSEDLALPDFLFGDGVELTSTALESLEYLGLIEMYLFPSH